MAVKTLDDTGNFSHPLYQVMLRIPGVSVGTAVVDDLLTWGLTNALWVFPMATSCCGIELMAAAASRVDLDRMGTIIRATPRQADVMVVAGTITTKMAPRVKKLWEQMPEPKWAIAMGSCAISGDFYRNLYSVVPGIDTFLPVDVYIPGCPPNPEGLMHGLLRLAQKVRAQRKGLHVVAEPNPDLMRITMPSVPRLQDASRTAAIGEAQMNAASNPTDLEDTAALQVDAPPEAPTPSQAPDALALFTELGVAELPKDGPPLIPAARHLDCARRLKALGYLGYLSCVATHWLAGTGRKGKESAEPEHYEVTTVVRTVGEGSRVASWTVRLGLDEPLLTLSGIYPGAEWQEREQYDLVGVKFAGHPDLRRLMMMENFVPHPLRRDFPADAPFAPWR